MKNLIIIGIVGIVLFGASFAGSTFLLKEQKQADENGSADADQAVANQVSQTHQPYVESTGGDVEKMPVPFKPNSLTEESVLKMVESIQQREEAIIAREEEILERESRQRFILKDIQREKREFEAITEQVQAKIEQAKRLLQTVEQKKAEIVAEQQKIEQMQADINQRSTPRAVSEQNNIKKIAEWIGSMPAEDAASTFKRYANDGKMLMAAQILRQIEERTAAKILTAMNDPVLVTQLLDEFKNTVPPQKKQR